jgi:photosystem II stability/assembly factor-like uncharacterized protein
MKVIRYAVITALTIGIGLVTSDLIHAPKTEKDFAEDNEAKSESLDMLQWMSKSRAYPNADIPVDGYTNAMEQYHLLQSTQRMQSIGTWSSIGPNNIGGRTLCVALDPADTNTVWLGSASGGLWKSTTGGMGTNAWNYVNVGYPVLGVATIAINSSNAAEMYIGTGESYNQGTSQNGLTERITRGTYGMGIFKSTDGGVSWQYALNWSYQQQRTVWDIVINPLRPQTVFAATSEGVYKSTDSGNTWAQVLNIPVCMDIALHQTDTSVVLVGAGNMNSINKGLYRSADGGLNWSMVGNGFPNVAHQGRIMIEMYQTNNDIMMAQLCDIYNTIGFYKSTDKGVNWTNVSAYDVCGYQAWYCAGMAFKPGDPNTFMAGGVNLYRSTDGGSTFSQVSNNNWWTDYAHSDMHAILVNPQNPNSLFIATDGGLFRSWDFGDTYTECTDGYVTSQCYIGSVSQSNPNYALTGLQDNYSIQYTGSPYWTSVVGGDGCYNLIDPIDDNINFAAYQYLNVFITTDQWQSNFQVINTPASAFGNNPAAFLAPIMFSPANNQRLYAGARDLMRSDDGGFSWNVVSASPIDSNNCILSMAGSSTFADSIYIATAPDFAQMKFLLSTDGGNTFVDRSAGLPDRFPRRIAVDPRNSKIVYAVFSGFGTGHVFKSTNAGVSWSDISTSLPDVPFHAILLDPQFPDVVYAGSDMGLYVSTDGGVSWTTHNTGLPDWSMVFDLQTCGDDRSILCFTHGHGVWRRNLNDVLGIEIPDQSFVANVFPNPASDKVFITYGEEIQGEAEMNIYDLMGKLIYTRKEKHIVAGSSSEIDVSTWSNGTYILQVKNKGIRHNRSLVISH